MGRRRISVCRQMKCKWKDRLTYHISKNSHLTISSVGEAVGEQTSYTAGKMKNIKPHG